MKNHFIFALSCLLILSMACCSKSNIGPPQPLEDGNSIIIKDLPGDIEASVGSTGPGKEKRDFHTFLFRFSDQSQIWLKTASDSMKNFPTTDWDLAFSNYYNSSIYINNGLQSNVPFSGNPSRHRLVLIEKSYDDVQSAPSDSEFDKSELYNIGLITGEGSKGWFNYNMNSHLVQVMPNRTYVFRLSNGQYGKLQLLNVYKGNPPTVTDLNWPAPYFTLRYYIQQDGSKNLKTK